MKSGPRLPLYYGWVVVAASFVILALSYTVWYSFTVFFVAILEEFSWSRALTAGAFSVCLLVNGLTGPVVGALTDRRGARWVVGLGSVVLVGGLVGCSRISEPWQLYLFYGLIAALGVSATGWVPNVALLGNWFSRRLGAVLGIASAGIGFGIVFLVPLAQYLIARLGWRYSFLILAVAMLVVILPATLLFHRRRPQDIGLQPDGMAAGPRQSQADQDRLVLDRAWAARTWTLRSAAATPRFWFAFTASFLLSFAVKIAMVHEAALLVDAGYDKMLAAAAVGMVGMASMVGKLVWGAASDRVGRELAFSAGMICGVIGIGLLILAGPVQAIWLPYLASAWIGLGYAVSAPMAPAVTSDMFRGKSFGSIFGLMNMGNNVGGAVGAWFAGYVFDLTGEYLLAMVLGMLAILIACASLWLAAPRRVRMVPGQWAREARPVRVSSS